jgi:beta-phosphoglucomutase-like phosphatase (HAD superfamily)
VRAGREAVICDLLSALLDSWTLWKRVAGAEEELGLRAADRLGAPLAAIVPAERAGRYKPHPAPYRLALDELGVAPERALYLAGAPTTWPARRKSA